MDWAGRRLVRVEDGGSAMPTHHAADTTEVHVATNHEVDMCSSSDHVGKSQGSDTYPTTWNLMK